MSDDSVARTDAERIQRLERELIELKHRVTNLERILELQQELDRERLERE